jgi:nucleoside-diphosphate-sugar epimerase
MVERVEGIKVKYMKTALVLGAGGFIGSHMVKRLKSEGYWVRGVDIKYPEFSETQADEFIIRDLSESDSMNKVILFKGYSGNFYKEIPYKLLDSFDEIYQFAADMGGAGYIFTGEHDSQIMENSALINLNLLRAQSRFNDEYGVNKTKIFY